MSRTCKAWAAKEVKAPLEQVDVELAALGGNDVEVKVVSCGICASDVHLIDGDWGPFSAYPNPQVSGHEIIGRVVSVGSSVTHLQEGQLVGVGWQKASCLNCQHCAGGDENLCDGNTPTCAGGNVGGFAEYWRGDSRFAFPIPEGLEPKYAAPLLCGGITVYSPLVEYSSPGDRVGVVGIGGLGHMAVRMASARGCLVTAISSSADKEPLARDLGATSFVSGRDDAQMAAAKNSLDLLIVTVSVPLDWSKYLAMLRPRGTICFVGAVLAPMELPIFGDLIMKKLQVVGSCIGGRSTIQHMLEFCRDHKVYPVVEEVPFADINAALDKVRANKQRFRMVVSHSTE